MRAPSTLLSPKAKAAAVSTLGSLSSSNLISTFKSSGLGALARTRAATARRTGRSSLAILRTNSRFAAWSSSPIASLALVPNSAHEATAKS
jgi:hypothetical protein